VEAAAIECERPFSRRPNHLPMVTTMEGKKGEENGEGSERGEGKKREK
jgi:hypothetical protein